MICVRLHHIAVLALVGLLAACSVQVSLTRSESAPAALPGVAGLASGGAACHAAPDAARPQYIVGYGSLMQDESRKRTSPQAGAAHPVDVQGFRRGWFARPPLVGFTTTFLGALPDPPNHLNAVIYQVDLDEVAATDRREASYCRASVAIAAIKSLDKAFAPAPEGQAWIYVNRPQGIAPPDARYPIVESYVDIFLSGCLEQEQRFGLTGFARDCLTTTSDWSTHWVNDRLYPRRPFVYQPRAIQIDDLLHATLPKYFSSIRIEGQGSN